MSIQLCKFGASCLRRADCKYAHPAVTAGETVAQVKAHKKAISKMQVKKHPMLSIITAMRPLVRRRSELLEKQRAFRAKYVMVDVKDTKEATTPMDADLKVVELEMKALKETFTRTFGNKPIRIPLTWALRVTNTANNLNARSLSLDPSLSGDWASCAALFDEVKTNAVELVYTPTGNLTTTAGVTSGASMAVMSYDPSDLTVLSSLEEGCMKSHHTLYSMAVAMGAATNPVSQYNRMHKLHVKVPPGPLVNSPATSNTAFVGNAWAVTNGTPGAIDICGAVEWYEVNNVASASACGDLVVYFDTEFRVRN